MKYIKKFNNLSSYEAFKESDSYITPNVCLIAETNQIIKEPYDPTNGFEYVDLGLPSGTLWAKCNVGATKPEESGLYFSWGDSQGYTKAQVQSGEYGFHASDYKYQEEGAYWFCDGSTMIKYNDSDDKTVLDPEDDTATANMGGDWHMPTKEQCEELSANTTSTWTTMNGVNGRLFTSKTNGNTLFVPAAGYCEHNSIYYEGSSVIVWSSSLYEYLIDAWCLYLDSSNMRVKEHCRYLGSSVRGVLG